MTVPDPESAPEPEDNDVDPFAELGVETNPSPGNVSDGLEAFMEDDEVEEPTDSAPLGVVHEEGEEDEDDMFATLGVAGPSVSLASSDEHDLLTAFMEEDDESETSSDRSDEPSNAPDGAIDAYKMVLETVWVDGILDPGEVHLLAKRRDELGLSFEEHLDLVREMLG